MRWTRIYSRGELGSILEDMGNYLGVCGMKLIRTACGDLTFSAKGASDKEQKEGDSSWLSKKY